MASASDLKMQQKADGKLELCFDRGSSCSKGAKIQCCQDWICRCNFFGSNCRCDRPSLLFFG